MERCILACSGMAWKMGKNFVNMSVNSTTDLNYVILCLELSSRQLAEFCFVLLEVD